MDNEREKPAGPLAILATHEINILTHCNPGTGKIRGQQAAAKPTGT